MPTDALDLDVMIEATYTSTNCLCPNSEFHIHEADCLHKPRPKQKLSPLAGKRAWKKEDKTNE